MCTCREDELVVVFVVGVEWFTETHGQLYSGNIKSHDEPAT